MSQTLTSLILRCVQDADQPLTTSDIYERVAEAENITMVAGACRDLTRDGKLDRERHHSRWFYTPASARNRRAPEGGRADTANALRPAPRPGPATRAIARPIRARRAIDLDTKLRVLDRLADIVATDIADVLHAIGEDLRGTA